MLTSMRCHCVCGTKEEVAEHETAAARTKTKRSLGVVGQEKGEGDNKTTSEDADTCHNFC